MSKIVKNTTGSSISVSDVGITIPASPGSYTIQPQDYLIWSASNDIVTYVGNGTLVINDGSSDLSISDGIDVIKDIFPKRIGVLAGDDFTQIGHVGDRLKVDAQLSSGSVTITALAAACNVIKQNEIAVTVKVETDLPNSTYTVPAGKLFNMVSVGGSFDAAQPMYLRLKKQTGGTGSFITIFRATLSVNGQDASNYSVTVPNGVAIGVAGDVFKLTYEPAVGRGSLWAGYFGVEY